eukprot:TRINITY_DN3306_c1_g1_i4.p4 TRINITY_DN3306_c1_g1~~TRINITY_DN3306_c1_g1_i4.p4  ORF type:complete len:51 (-),score=3.28 TRINITY_DN3306_c1_g1_i4:107-259(-)
MSTIFEHIYSMIQWRLDNFKITSGEIPFFLHKLTSAPLSKSILATSIKMN